MKKKGGVPSWFHAFSIRATPRSARGGVLIHRKEWLGLRTLSTEPRGHSVPYSQAGEREGREFFFFRTGERTATGRSSVGQASTTPTAWEGLR